MDDPVDAGMLAGDDRTTCPALLLQLHRPLPPATAQLRADSIVRGLVVVASFYWATTQLRPIRAARVIAT